MTAQQTFGRILALDLGKRRIGLALSDPLRITAQGIETLIRVRVREDLETLAQLAGDRGVSEFLFGEPLHMSGDESRQSVYTHEFAERLAAPVPQAADSTSGTSAGRRSKPAAYCATSGISIEKRAPAPWTNCRR